MLQPLSCFMCGHFKAFTGRSAAPASAHSSLPTTHAYSFSYGTTPNSNPRGEGGAYYTCIFISYGTTPKSSPKGGACA